jgi:WD40 repeat protein
MRYYPLTGNADAIAASPDGSLLAVSIHQTLSPIAVNKNVRQTKNWIEIWNVKTDSMAFKLPYPQEIGQRDIHALAFSPDGARLAAGGSINGLFANKKYVRLQPQLTIWDIRSGKASSQNFDPSSREITALCYSPDGSHLVCGTQIGTELFCDGQNGMLLRNNKAARMGRPIQSIVYQSDKSAVIAVSDFGAAESINPETGDVLADFGKITRGAVSQDGNMIVSVENARILLYNVSGGSPQIIKVYPGAVSIASVSPDKSEVAIGGMDGEIRMINLNGAVLIHPADIRMAARICVTLRAKIGAAPEWIWMHLNPDSRDTIRQYNFNTPVTPAFVQMLADELNRIIRMPDFYSPERFSLLGLSPDIIEEAKQHETGDALIGFNRALLETVFPKELADSYMKWMSPSYIRPAFSLTCATHAPMAALGGIDGTLRIIDTDSGRLISSLGRGPAISYLAISPSGRLAAVVGGGGLLNVWDTQAKQLLLVYRGHKSSITGMAFSDDGKYIASASLDKTIRIWAPDTGELIRVLPELPQPITAMALSRSGDIAVIMGRGANAAGEIISASNGNRIASLTGTKFIGDQIGFSPDGRFVATWSKNGRGGIHLWNAHTGKLNETLLANQAVTAMAFSPDSNFILAAVITYPLMVEPARIMQMDIASGQVKRTIDADERGIDSLAFTSDGKRLLMGGMDNLLKIWSWPSFTLLRACAAPLIGEQPTRDQWITWTPGGQEQHTPDAAEAIYHREGTRILATP